MFEVDLVTLQLRPFHLLDKEWAILVGGKDKPNPMTVSWGGLGTLWNRPVVTIYVRPTRFTFERLNEHPEFTLNFLEAERRSALNICGTVSGRDQDKWELSDLAPTMAKNVGVPRVKGARFVFECRVLAHVDIDPARLLEPAIDKLYPEKDYHRVYFGEVLGAFRSEAGEG